MKKITHAISSLAVFVTIGWSVHPCFAEVVPTGAYQDAALEIAGATKAVIGYADLNIYSSVKTHKPGIYSSKDAHGTPDFKLLLSIDDQPVVLQGRLQKDDGEKRHLHDPEAGEGVRYHFDQKVRLKTGTHKIVVVIPEDDLKIEKEISISEGRHSLALEPIYGSIPVKRQAGLFGSTSFREGIRTIRLVLNGKPL
ncbi:MAG TPA: hypothetical protein VGJ93_12385 [Desulfuromonadaceae bacterium]|jgi:hypothetical protein